LTTLGALLGDAGLPAPEPADAAALLVSSVELDSRQCAPGSVFVCMPGTTSNGTAFAADAVRRGAICVVAAPPVPAVPTIVRIQPDRLRGALAALSSSIVGHPASSLAMAGVTGTNGKTTVTWLLNGILANVGYASATIGTLTGQRTTPSAPDLQRALREVADRATHEGLPGAVALEVSSHALDQGRVDGIRFDVAVFTNLSREHLDYHGTMERYFAAKAGLFEPSRTAAAVVCVDDEWGRTLAARRAVPTIEVSSDDALIEDAEIGRTSFRWRSQSTTTRLTGRVNLTNAMLALAAAEVVGIDVADASLALTDVPSVPGRLEVVDGGPPSVLVDYAHSPDALARVLTDVRTLRPASRLVVVFGCGGERDRGKRPVMGSIASRLADVVVVTSDNPRGESPEAIIAEIVSGCDGKAKVLVEADRALAITESIGLADAGDVVLLAGKGHETTQEVAGELLPFDDRLVAAAALSARGSTC
jgi:UDP-N-acetylmuramoyl-L-alanyl-D-glutamate--2,6-diaminopimelate ligase